MRTVAVVCLLLFSAAAARADSFEVTVTTDTVFISSSTSFSCNDKIFALIKMPEKSTGTHLLEGRWFKPDGGQKEYTRVPLELKGRGEDRFQLWLKIERAGDAVDAFFTHYDDDDLDGLWTLDIYYDGKKKATAKFTLHCA
jgi:hypothetical protein